jgi:hypothetical protein
MKLQPFESPFPHLIVNQLYNTNEINLIENEFNFIMRSDKVNECSSLILNTIYYDSRFSDILNLNRKIYDAGIVNIFSETSPQCKLISKTNFDITKLVNLKIEENNGECKFQVENEFNFVSYTSLDSSTFLFPEYDYRIDVDKNSFIIFPSHVVYGIIKGKCFVEQLLSVMFKNE